MPLGREIRNEIREARKLRLPWWALLFLGAGTFLCAWLFDSFGKLEIVLPMLNSGLVLGFVIALKRKLWPRVWFWGCMAVIAALHVPLILFVPWTTQWFPALAIAGIDSLDFCLILWILAASEKFLGEPNEADGRPLR